MDSYEQMFFLDFPEEITEHILSYLSYHETSEARAVCKVFNKHCQRQLNRGFAKVDKLHAQIQKEVKNKLPRRESERRNHSLARHVDILSAIETRLSLLGMSYMKYIDTALCCFIPGKVLDELFSILTTLQSSSQPPRSHEFLQELRDISSMAMEHFDEKIAPDLKTKLHTVSLGPSSLFSDSCACPQEPQAGTSTVTTFSLSLSPVRGPSIRSEVNNLGSQMRAQGLSVQQLKKDAAENKIGYMNQKKRHNDQEKKLILQGHLISELEKKVNDLNQKFIDMSAEMNKLKGRQEVEKEGSAVPCLHGEEYKGVDNTEKEENSDTKRNKALKRKFGGMSESRVKKSKRTKN